MAVEKGIFLADISGISHFLLLSVAALIGWRLKTVSLTCPAMPGRGEERREVRRGIFSQVSSSTGERSHTE